MYKACLIARPRAAAMAAALGLVLALGAGGAWAQNAEEEDIPLDTKVMRQLLKDLGLQRDIDQGIDYRERPPLVVPPTHALPPPQSDSAVTSNPAWPQDPDVKRRKAEAERRLKAAKTAAEAEIAAGRPLTPAELEAGRVAAGTTGSTTPATPEESARPLRPSELGASAKKLWSGVFSSFGDQTETAEFAGEAPRPNLTAPPPGYQTPSPDQPYGITPKDERAPAKPEDRVTSYSR